jgi:hypothetical protein
MKVIYCILILILFYSCKKVEKEINLTPLIHKAYFSVSENDKKLDSTRNIKRNDSREILEINIDKRYNKDYHIGGIHFLIQDSTKSYYFINYLENQVIICGNISPLLKEDSIKIINENIEKIQNIKPIKTNEIIDILKKYQNKIVSKGNSPLQISFALKNDTIYGTTMYNILQFMEKQKMSLYEIRRMNNAELKKVQ